jgi:hypothetical protein
VLIEWLKGTVFNDSNHSNPPTEVLKDHYTEILKHQVVDWLVSNHDSHAGNFLVTPDGKVGGFDKGQAWKFIGKDKLDPDYQPNNSKQIYIPFWERVKSEQVPLNQPMAVKAIGEALDAIDKITDEQFKAIVTPYVKVRAKKEGVNGNSLYQKMLGRKNMIRGHFEAFLTKQFGTTINLPKAGADKPLVGP